MGNILGVSSQSSPTTHRVGTSTSTALSHASTTFNQSNTLKIWSKDEIEQSDLPLKKQQILKLIMHIFDIKLAGDCDEFKKLTLVQKANEIPAIASALIAFSQSPAETTLSHQVSATLDKIRQASKRTCCGCGNLD